MLIQFWYCILKSLKTFNRFGVASDYVLPFYSDSKQSQSFYIISGMFSAATPLVKVNVSVLKLEFFSSVIPWQTVE